MSKSVDKPAIYSGGILADKCHHYLIYIYIYDLYTLDNENLQINALCVIICCFHSLIFLVVKHD